MDADKQKALEAAGWKFGSVDEFLGERPMSDKSDYYLVIGPIEKMLDGYPATDRKEWLEDAGWKDVQIVWADEQNVDYQAAYAAGRKAEREEMQREREEWSKAVNKAWIETANTREGQL